MKAIKILLLSSLAVLSAVVFNSCDHDDGYTLDKVWYSYATVYPLNEQSYYLKLDNGKTIWPVAQNGWYNPAKIQRVWAEYSLLSDAYQGYDHAAKVYSLQNILTKPLASDLGEGNNEKYGTAPVDIEKIWIADKFLHIVFNYNYGGNAVHFINLVNMNSSDSTYVYNFRHHSYNDSDRYRRRGIVAFDLSTLRTNGQEVELTVKVKSFDGDKEYKIKYNTSLIQPAAEKYTFTPNVFDEVK